MPIPAIIVNGKSRNSKNPMKQLSLLQINSIVITVAPITMLPKNMHIKAIITLNKNFKIEAVRKIGKITSTLKKSEKIIPQRVSPSQQRPRFAQHGHSQQWSKFIASGHR